MNGLCKNDLITEEDGVATVRSVRRETRHIININTHISLTNAIYLPGLENQLSSFGFVKYVATTQVRHHIPCTKIKDLSTSFPFSA